MNNSSLVHWLGKGEEAENHKYTKREWKNGKWVYYYDTTSSSNTKSSPSTNKYAKTNNSSTASTSNKSGSTLYDLAKANQAKKESEKKSTGQMIKDWFSNIGKSKKTDEASNTSKTAEKTTDQTIAKKDEKTTSSLYDKSGTTLYDLAKKNASEKESNNDSNVVTDFISKGKQLLDSIFGDSDDPLSKLKQKTSTSTPDEDMALINPNYSPDDDNKYNENCGYCTIAYDLRRRGYDVTAKAEKLFTGGDLSLDDILDMYDGAKAVEHKSGRHTDASDKELTAKIEKELLDFGDGARGHLCLSWNRGGGHDVAWEVVDGKVMIMDSQINKRVELYDYVERAKTIRYVRTDNLSPNKNVLKYVDSRKED